MKYGLLEDGQEIKEGDEYYHPKRCKWIKYSKDMFQAKQQPKCLPTRRLIEVKTDDESISFTERQSIINELFEIGENINEIMNLINKPDNELNFVYLYLARPHLKQGLLCLQRSLLKRIEHN